jgi:hypothetical protein
MTYTFKLDVPPSMVSPHAVINWPVWGGNINGYRHHSGRMHQVRALVLHTPEEAADRNPQTPKYFGTPGVMRSTHYFAATPGDLIQMVADRDAAWGQGTHDGNRVWKGVAGAWAPWNPRHISNNQLSLGIEIEGHAATIDQTITPEQFETVARWIAYKSWQYDIPLDRDHVVGHYELALDKTDPGKLPIEKLLRRARQLRSGDDLRRPRETPKPGVPPEDNLVDTNVPTVVMSKRVYEERLRTTYRLGRDRTLDEMSTAIRAASHAEVRRIIARDSDQFVDKALEELLP